MITDSNQRNSTWKEKAIDYAKTKSKKMVIFLKIKFKFQRMQGETTKDSDLTLLEEISKAVFECLHLFHQKLGTCSKSIDRTMSKFVVSHFL